MSVTPQQYVLVIEDQESTRLALESVIKKELPAFEVLPFESADDFLATDPTGDANVVAAVVDIVTGGEATGLDAAKRLASTNPGLPVVVFSGHLSEDVYAAETHPLAVAGELHVTYVAKPGESTAAIAAELKKVIADAAADARGIVIKDAPLREAFAAIRAIQEDAQGSVMVLGPSGSGKEEFVRRLHTVEGRDRPFEAVNGAAIGAQFVISEIFGHLHGSFTGADRHHAGRMLRATGLVVPMEKGAHESYLDWLRRGGGLVYLRRHSNGVDQGQADVTVMGRSYEVGGVSRPGKGGFRALAEWCPSQSWAQTRAEFILPLPEWLDWERDATSLVPEKPVGTLFIDEVADLPHEAQVALLRALNGDGFYPLGYAGPAFLAHVRVVAATNRISNLSDLSRDNLRHDLFWRLAGWVVTLPGVADLSRTVREEHFRRLIARRGMTETSEAIKALGDEGDWPGNWRQVEQVCVRAISVARSTGSAIVLPVHVRWALSALEFALDSGAGVLSPGRDGDAPSPPPVLKTGERWTMDDFRAQMVPSEDSKAYRLLERLYQRRGRRLTYDDFTDLFPDREGGSRIKGKGQKNLSAAIYRLKSRWPRQCGWKIVGGKGGYALLEG